MNEITPITKKVMTAPPSTKAQIVDVGFPHKALVDRLSPGGEILPESTSGLMQRQRRCWSRRPICNMCR